MARTSRRSLVPPLAMRVPEGALLPLLPSYSWFLIKEL
jgi:hypothetical protein